MLRIGIYGATGYTGFELIRILKHHPEAQIVWLTSEQSAGQTLGDAFATVWDDPLIKSEDAPLDNVDVVFLALPHGASVPMVKKVIDAGVRAIDRLFPFWMCSRNLGAMSTANTCPSRPTSFANSRV